MGTGAEHKRLIILCERLTGATLADAAEWRDSGVDNYLWEHEQGSVSIGARDRDGQPPYELAIFNADGEKVEELASALVEDDLPAEWNQPLAGLYRAGRRSALHADAIIDALMNALPMQATGAEAQEEIARGAIRT